MSYSDPPEWSGRGARDRSGWPNETFNPGVARSHRAPRNDRDHARPEDTAEFRPSRQPFHEEMPTDPGIRYQPRRVMADRTVDRQELVVPLERDGAEMPGLAPLSYDPVERFDSWLRVVVHLLAIVALVGSLWLIGMVIADNGVPLWVPRS